MTTPGSADQVIFDQVNGLGENNRGLSYAEVAFLYDAHLLGLGKDYAFAEGPNVSFSRLDAITTMAKILSRSHSHVDGNTYDIWDAVQTILKWVLTQSKTINDNEVNSVNHKASDKDPVDERVRPTALPPTDAGLPVPACGAYHEDYGHKAQAMTALVHRAAGPPPPPPGYTYYYSPPPSPWHGPWL